ncbi:hypothetical protein [Halomonas nitroreducens]|uniref:Uncharacterized protein n=1 Tax=Halomonas nitroreducens TaxID=447425 RepID=A0A431V2F1_9GAMM|nr:hypothetical protein [Halomonas nitroreducens]RTR02370.1 hypothetical protein EKG36_12270 [Halomonas nitroreducens]
MLNALSPWLSGSLRELTGSFLPAWTLLALGVGAMLRVTWHFDPRHYSRAMSAAVKPARSAGEGGAGAAEP